MGRPRMWSDKEFRERVALRAKAIGKSKRQILVAAGLALDTLEKIPARGRRLDTLEKISTALGWSLAETMGHDVIGRVTPELLGVAFGIANRGLRYRPHDEATVIEITARVYNILADHQRDGIVIDQKMIAMVVSYIASETQKSE